MADASFVSPNPSRSMKRSSYPSRYAKQPSEKKPKEVEDNKLIRRICQVLEAIMADAELLMTPKRLLSEEHIHTYEEAWKRIADLAYRLHLLRAPCEGIHFKYKWWSRRKSAALESERNRRQLRDEGKNAPPLSEVDRLVIAILASTTEFTGDEEFPEEGASFSTTLDEEACGIRDVKSEKRDALEVMTAPSAATSRSESPISLANDAVFRSSAPTVSSEEHEIEIFFKKVQTIELCTRLGLQVPEVVRRGVFRVSGEPF